MPGKILKKLLNQNKNLLSNYFFFNLLAYLHDVFSIPIETTSAYTSISNICALISKILSMAINGYLIRLTNQKRISLTNLRKVFQAITMFLPAFCFLIITFKSDDKYLDMVMIFSSMFFMGFTVLGEVCNLNSLIKKFR